MCRKFLDSLFYSTGLYVCLYGVGEYFFFFFLLNSWKMRWIPCLLRKSLLLMVSSIWKFIRSDLRMAFYHNLPAVQETWVWFLRWQDPLEKGMATHSSILVWKIPWTEESGRLQSMGLLRVGHNWVNNTFTFHQPSFKWKYFSTKWWGGKKPKSSIYL